MCVCVCVLLSGQIMILHIFSQMPTSNNKSPHLCPGLCGFWGMLSILSQNFYSVLAFISCIHRALTLARGETLGLYQVFRIHTATAMCIGLYTHISSVQSITHVWLLQPHDCSTPGLPVHHQFPESTQTHVHQVSDAIQPSYPLTSTSRPTFSLSHHQGLFKWVRFSHKVAMVFEFQLQHQSFQWTPRTDLL